MSMQGRATLSGQIERGLQGDFKAGGRRTEAGVVLVRQVAVSQGDMGADSVFEACGGNQVEGIFSGVAAMDEMGRAAPQQAVERAAAFGQMVVGVGENADDHRRGGYAQARERGKSANSACSGGPRAP